MITARNATSYITRNSSQFKRVTITTQPDFAADPLDDKKVNNPTPDHPVEIRRYRAGQNRRPPQRLNIEYQH